MARHFWIVLMMTLLIKDCFSLIQGKWTKLSLRPLCVGAKNDHYANLRYNKEEKFLAAIKFVHAYGQIRCHSAGVHGSNWGCARGGRSPLNIFLTDNKNNIIFPNENYVRFSTRGKWYGLPGFTEISPTLVMSNFASPFYLYRNQHMRIWYGEDLQDYSEKDNHGVVCMHVYGYLI